MTAAVSLWHKIFATPKRYFNREVLPLLADLKLAIALLLIIAVFSIWGTVIEQGQSLQFYQNNYPEDPALFGFLTWKVLLTAGLDHVYRTWWYLGLLILFGSSLMACTFKRQLPAWKWFTRDQKLYSKPQQFRKFALSAEVPSESITPLMEQLQQRNYRIVSDEHRLYARKGIIGRLAPIVVHISMLIILIGGVVGALTGFIAQEMVPSGQTFQVNNVTDAGPWAASQVPKDWSVKVNRFWIDYLPTGEIDQFYSDMSVLDQGGTEVDRQTIHVNKPLRHKGVTLYQASWSVAAVKVKFNNSPVLELPMGELKTKGGRLWGAWLPLDPNDMSNGASLVVKDLQGLVLIYDKTGKLVSTVRKGMAVELNGIRVSIVDLVGSTGLQIKADPGVPIVYLGFGLLMLSTLMSYISHTQVWGLWQDGRLYLGGVTNRAQVGFEREFLSILDTLEVLPDRVATPSAE
ncbi:cytochrome c biogenesis protein [filamentous cyanobacterium LEGE 11480]|uniref:Cytochrome c biogenesis protein CcsB n=1 Tax=Romeriopsis navalis LEGE 11480 TaxID=2777977 RepID=A0A928Z1Z6_9CYAN|nr:cytochrome c biogenesis protein [Romeriopsis navalis]MBE9028517.1 cytochrome c biogenesis protein [Romeriopsis navalis LEGE 11480]